MTWRLPDTPAELLALAGGYPYFAPRDSYLFEDGEARPLKTVGPELFWGRAAVLAHGSNRSPEQLRRKFGRGAVIPVTCGVLSDYDVAYGAHVARYGAVTSTLAASPGTAARVAVTWLTPEQLAAMHETERTNYIYGRLPSGAFQPEIGPATEPLTAYIGCHGLLRLDGAPVALAAVSARGRRLPAMTQMELQARLAALHEPGEALESLLLARIADPGRRLAFAERLRDGAPPEPLPGFTPLQDLA